MNHSNNTLAQNAMLNGIKQACAVLFPFLSFAYCSRVIGKDGLGIYSFSQSVVSYFILIAAMGIPNYSIREGSMIRNDEDKLRSFINQVFTISCVSMVLSYVLLIATVLAVPKLQKYHIVIIVLSAQLFLTTIGADWVNTIIEDYLYLTIRYIVMQVVAFISLVVFVHDASDVIIYSIITMLSNVGGNILNLIYLKRKDIFPRITSKIDIKKHLTPILILFANSVAGIVYLNSDITMLGFYLSEADVGVYTVSSKVYSLVKTLINAVIMVTVPRFSFYLGNGMKEEYKTKLNDVAQVLLIVLVPCIVGLIMEAPKVILLVAGKGYEEGIPVVRILGAALLFAVYACMFSYSILIPHRKEVGFMIATVVAAVVNIGLNFLFIPAMGINGAAITTLIAEVIVVAIAMVYSKKLAFPFFDSNSIISAVLGGIVVALICIVFDRIGFNNLLGFVAEIIVCGIGYILALVILRNRKIIELLHSISAKRKEP